MIISVFDREENIVGKGEIACTSNFSFSHNVFKRLLSQRRQKASLCGNGLSALIIIAVKSGDIKCCDIVISVLLSDRKKISLTLSQTSYCFHVSAVQVFRKLCGKSEQRREMAPFRTAFSSYSEMFAPFSSNIKLSSANSLSLEEYKVCCVGKS